MGLKAYVCPDQTNYARLRLDVQSRQIVVDSDPFPKEVKGGMEKAAAQLLGEPVVIGATIATKGTLSKMAVTAGAFQAGGVIGGLAGSAIGAALGNNAKAPTTPGNYKGLAFIAVTPTNVAFFSVKRGLLKNSIKELLVQHPRADLAGMEVGGGLIPSVTVAFNDGTIYALEVAKLQKGKADKVKQELGK